MGTFAAFILIIVAIINSIFVIASPIERKNIEWSGKTLRERDEFMLQFRSGGWTTFYLFALFIVLIVNPLYIIWALVNHYGNAYVGLAALAVFVIEVITIFIRKPEKVTIKDADGKYKRVLKSEVTSETRVYYIVGLRATFKRAFSAIPAAYLWYLFLVVLGILS